MLDNSTHKSLSHDEKKAAEAAFAGRPFNPSWSASARVVYDGIIKALPAPAMDAVVLNEEPVSAPSGESLTGENPQMDNPDSQPSIITDIKQAIEAGVLIDVTPTAKQLGISFPMTITKPLWEAGIASSQTLTEEEKASRLRDVLMAFRLRLASLTTVSPLLDFPALLAMPPSAVPQPVPLFALIQPDQAQQMSVTLLLPNEVSLTIIPRN